MLFFELLIILISTKLAGDLSVRLGQPSVLGKLLVGILIGPAVLGWIDNSHTIKELSEIGVLLLMFLAGLETDINELNKNRRSSFAVAIGGIILPMVGGYLAGKVLGISDTSALFIGLLLSATSVSITVQTLRDMGKLKTKESVTILGAAIVDDVLVVVLLAFLMSFVGAGDVSLGLVIGKKIAFFLIAILLGWKVVPWLMRWLVTLRVTQMVISTGLIICFGFAFLSEEMGVAGIIGAFIAGVAISQTPYKHEVEQKLEPIAYAVFVPVFFVSIGLSVSFTGLGDQIGLILGLTVLAVATKLVGSGLGARLTGFNLRSSFGIGTGMISRGEVALIIASLGLERGLLAQEFYTSTIIVVILTTLLTPPLLKKVF
ncbi:transporter, monovalent cation:proton antiporter-2 (CPA2) family [Marininema halotolerans]|uniref:Transporter, monovalent cation:proton antiporter-2 (CPA2) family n=1 Tax=Marininema halotolerans TaxID=1155944 RepID=A0A1I6Q0F2_9BACL|nr:transporter, monovalent cation:proton antiporter-2 (CPA2) family [Marininema halotolerans]